MNATQVSNYVTFASVVIANTAAGGIVAALCGIYRGGQLTRVSGCSSYSRSTRALP